MQHSSDVRYVLIGTETPLYTRSRPPLSVTCYPFMFLFARRLAFLNLCAFLHELFPPHISDRLTVALRLQTRKKFCWGDVKLPELPELPSHSHHRDHSAPTAPEGRTNFSRLEGYVIAFRVSVLWCRPSDR